MSVYHDCLRVRCALLADDKQVSQVIGAGSRIEECRVVDHQLAVLVDRDGTVVVAIQSLEPEPLKLISDAIDRLTKE